ncbi:MAG: hypothetical protein ABH879_07245 [archaeon]
MDVKEVIKAFDQLDYYDLKKLEKEIDSGNLRRKLYENIRKHEEGRKICVTCGNSLHDKKFSLVFEHEGLKKTAEFCALDCMEYFISRMKKLVKVE